MISCIDSLGVGTLEPRTYCVTLEHADPDDLAGLGGKGANLARLVHARFRVPAGFCVTTAAYRAWAGDLNDVYHVLEGIDGKDAAALRKAGTAVRRLLGQRKMPADVSAAIVGAWRALEDASGDPVAETAPAGSARGYAVRSSATAEDLPTASFAGQQDTFLNVQGAQAVCEAVRKAWISLYTDRAIAYRGTSGFDHRDVAVAVVVQAMVDAQASGILFTADPLTGRRHVASIDAGPGLGEALVSGVSSADQILVDRRTRQILDSRPADKSFAIRTLPDGGTEKIELTGEARLADTLSSAQALTLVDLGANIEALFGAPQDIEWSLDAAGAVHILQSRPITTLYPLPSPPPDNALHAYVSFGHAQVMTDAMPPLARSVLRTVFPFGRPKRGETPYLTEAGGRLWLDATPLVAEPALRKRLPRGLTAVEPLLAGALAELVARQEFDVRAKLLARPLSPPELARYVIPLLLRAMSWVWMRDVDSAAATMAVWCDRRAEAARANVAAAKPGAPRLVAAADELLTVFPDAFRKVVPCIAGGLIARLILTRLLPEEGQDIEILLSGLRGNVTTDMILEVGDLADIARDDPAAVAALTSADPAAVAASGPAFVSAWNEFLRRYGDRGPSEIDVAVPRWGDDPSGLMAMIAGGFSAEPGSHRQRHERLAGEAEAAAERLVEAARDCTWGRQCAFAVERLVRATRGLLAVREHPKFLLVRVLGEYRRAVMEEAARHVAAGHLAGVDDVWLLRVGELVKGQAYGRGNKSGEWQRAGAAPDWRTLVAGRRLEHAIDQKRRAPRLLTSDGEMIEGYSTAEVRPNALPGVGASRGVVEGVARVVFDPATSLLPGEILVAPFSDPGWTPLFLNAAGLVMEVGGLMTHGSVVAREYGIPAVVGVRDATRLIANGQRIRVNGDGGFVEILDTAE